MSREKLGAEEVYVLDKQFRRIKVISAFSSLIWVERYNGVGEFEMHTDKRFLAALFEGSYVYRKDKDVLGIIERKSVDNFTNDVFVRGRFAEALLECRIIDSTKVYSGGAEAVARDIVSDFCISGARKIEKLCLGEEKEIGSEVSVQRMGKTVFETLCEILNEQELSFRIRFELSENRLVFDVFKGLDRTMSQSVNAWCVFSTDYYNILNERYETATDTRNYAYVVGEDGDGQVIVTVDKTAGNPRREIYVDAKDIQKDAGMTDAAYRQLLFDRGAARLCELEIGDTVECEIDMRNTAEFALGDKCTYVAPELSLIAEGRVTEISEVVEANDISTTIILGKEQLSIVKKMGIRG